MYSHTSWKIWDSFVSSKSWGSTYMRVTLGQHICHEFFHKADDVSWARDGMLLRPVEQRSAAVGHWHVTFICITWYCSKMNGRERSTVHSVPRYRRQITDMGVAGTQLTSQVAYGIIVVVFDAAARRSVTHCCDQLLSLSKNTRTFRTATSRGTLLMASATSLTRRYIRGVDLYVDRLVRAYMRLRYA